MFREMCDRSKLIGKRDVENALKRLDKLTHEEARVMTAQNLKTVQRFCGSRRRSGGHRRRQSTGDRRQGRGGD